MIASSTFSLLGSDTTQIALFVLRYILPPLLMLAVGRRFLAVACIIISFIPSIAPASPIIAVVVFLATLLFRKSPAKKRTRTRKPRWSGIVGEAHYQKNIEKIAGGKTPDGVDIAVEADLIPEKGNPHDANAVRVDIHKRTVGYLDRSTAHGYRKKHGKQAYRVPARIMGGWYRGRGDEGHFGVEIQLP